MTPQTIKKHMAISDQIISGEIKGVSTIRLLYTDRLCQEAKDHLHKETKTKKFSTLMKKLKYTDKDLLVDQFIIDQCAKTGVFLKENVSSNYVPQFLEITKYEYQKILKAENIIPAGYDEIRMYGRYVDVPYFNIEDLARYYMENSKNGDLHKTQFKKKFKDFKLNFEKEEISFSHKVTFCVSLTLKENFKSDQDLTIFEKNINESASKIKEKINQINALNTVNSVNFLQFNNVDIYINKKEDCLQLSDKTEKLKKIDYNIATKLTFNQVMSFNNLYDIVCQSLYKDNPISHIEDITLLYPAMLNKKRKITFILGDTNSGKTHTAMGSLKKSETGIYLGPLRMLAQEKYEELIEAGVNAALITGEVQNIPENYTHVSATVETLNPDNHYDVGVIDEIQMVDDFDRGRYWLKALLALNADDVFVLGSKSFNHRKFIFSLLDKYQIHYEIIIRERMSTLTKIEKSVEKSKLEKGDVIVAFDKNTLFLIAEEVEKSGKSVSVLFSDLPYERKLEELDNFKKGVSEVLISTDAIAMGINLPIKRVLFYKCYKYDGASNSEIDFTLFKQIAGRAGRYKENGQFGIYKSNKVKSCLHENDSMFMEMKNISIFKDLANKLETEEEIKDLKYAVYGNNYIDDYLLTKISHFGLNYYETIMFFNQKNKNFQKIKEKNQTILKEISLSYSNEVLFKIMSLSPNDPLFSYSSVSQYEERFSARYRDLFVDEKITRYLNLYKLNSAIKRMISNACQYEEPWGAYARDLSYHERYDDYHYY